MKKIYKRLKNRITNFLTAPSRLEKKIDHLTALVKKSNFYTSGERQVAIDLDGIRSDHIGRYRFALRELGPANEKVLDIACGVGYGSYILGSGLPECNVVGVDVSHQVIEYAKKYYTLANVDFIASEAVKAGFQDEEFDAIVSFETIEHIKLSNQLLKNFYRWLKPGGLLVCSIPNQKTMPYDPDVFPHHVRHYTLEEFVSLIEGGGFKLRKVFSQHNTDSEDIVDDCEGLYLVAVAEKI